MSEWEADSNELPESSIDVLKRETDAKIAAHEKKGDTGGYPDYYNDPLVGDVLVDKSDVAQPVDGADPEPEPAPQQQADPDPAQPTQDGRRTDLTEQRRAEIAKRYEGKKQQVVKAQENPPAVYGNWKSADAYVTVRGIPNRAFSDTCSHIMVNGLVPLGGPGVLGAAEIIQVFVSRERANSFYGN